MSSAKQMRRGKNKQSNTNISISGISGTSNCASMSTTPFSINDIFNSVTKKDTTSQESFKVRRN